MNPQAQPKRRARDAGSKSGVIKTYEQVEVHLIPRAIFGLRCVLAQLVSWRWTTPKPGNLAGPPTNVLPMETPPSNAIHVSTTGMWTIVVRTTDEPITDQHDQTRAFVPFCLIRLPEKSGQTGHTTHWLELDHHNNPH